MPSHLNRIYRTALGGFLRDLIPYWRLRGDLCGDYPRAAWQRLSAEEQMAWYWQKCNGFIDSAGRALRRFKRFRHEDLFGAGSRGPQALLDFCGLSAWRDPLRLGRLKRNVAPDRFGRSTAWTPAVRDGVIALCRPLCARYGYTL